MDARNVPKFYLFILCSEEADGTAIPSWKIILACRLPQ